MPALALMLVEPRFGRAPDMLGDAIRTEDFSAGDRGRGLGVEAGENVMTGVLAADDDSGHDRLLSAPLVFVHPHNEKSRDWVPFNKARVPHGLRAMPGL